MHSASDFRRMADACREAAQEVPGRDSRGILAALACELEAEAWIAEAWSGRTERQAEGAAEAR